MVGVLKNILVIGGSYFAGRVFLETLAEKPSHSVWVFNRGNIPLGMEGFRQIEGDRENPDHIAHRIPKRHWHAVVDFCAYTPEHITEMLAGLTGTISHYIFLSTTSVYAANGDGPIGESAPKVTSVQPELGQFADYGFNKWMAERSLRSICQERMIPHTILRPSIIYGRYNYAPRESYFFDTVRQAKPLILPGRTSARFSFVWVEDLARLILRCIARTGVGCADVYNVAGPEAVSYADMVDVLETVCGRRPMVRKMALPQIVREKIPLPFPPDENLLYDGGKIAADLNFAYTPLVTGMRHTWAYYKARLDVLK